MKKFVFVFVLLVAVVVSGGLFLLTWDIPPPSQQVEKTLPDSKFPK